MTETHDNSGIGGSDAAAILDLYRNEPERLDPFKTALDVYERVTTVRRGDKWDPPPISFRAYMGQMAEPKIFKDFCDTNEFKRSEFRRNVKIMVDAEPHYRGEIDALSSKRDMLVDCKLVGRFAETNFGEEDSDEMPATMLCQLAYYRLFKPVSRCLLACWLDHKPKGQHYKQYEYTPDDELEETLRYVTEKFWTDHIFKEIPPTVQQVSDSKTIARIFPKQTLDLREATAAEVELVECIQRMKRDKGKLDEGLALAEGELKRLIGLHEGLKLPGGATVTWKANKTGEKTDWKLVAEKAGASAELIAECTQPQPGARPLRVPQLKD